MKEYDTCAQCIMCISQWCTQIRETPYETCPVKIIKMDQTVRTGLFGLRHGFASFSLPQTLAMLRSDTGKGASDVLVAKDRTFWATTIKNIPSNNSYDAASTITTQTYKFLFMYTQGEILVFYWDQKTYTDAHYYVVATCKHARAGPKSLRDTLLETQLCK